MNKKIKAVIFDWAGTTIDFGCFAPLHVFIEIFEKRGLSITLEEARGPMGMLKKDHIREILKMPRVAELWENKFLKEASEEDVESLYADFEPSLMSSLKNYTKVIDGVLDVCKYLEEKEIRIGSTTGYTKEMMTVVAAGAKGNGYAPELIITADDTGSGRPAPFMIFENMKRLNVFPPQSVIKVGDTVKVKIIDFDNKTNQARLSIKALNRSRVRNRRKQVPFVKATLPSMKIGFQSIAANMDQWIADAKGEILHDNEV